ncbi:hypothetical protein [Arundinibacter roseus]|uniref:Carboxypeptidase-like regulatory domain-containing protein n=1 Tax=Arundinibacter roseus TaxID=2070510 RepID=A0A4V2X9D6_9BACT|nr:hypothetical protein [Arundinibacter roseus]TDB63365.1 hypothetical protein EZE20_16465 [Arundinibacter roseus]
MKRASLLVLLLGIYVPLFGQSLHVTVLNALTDEPVPYVLISEPSHQNAAHTRALGTAQLPVRPDTIFVSAPGYLPTEIATNGRDSVLVKLEEKPLVVQEIGFTGRKRPQVVRTGTRHKRSQGRLTLCDSPDAFQFALFIPTPEKQRGILHKVFFYLEKEGKPRTPVRIRIYQNNDGKPGADLLDESVVITPKRWKRWKEVSMGKYNIPLPVNGFFVAMDWIYSSESVYQQTMRFKGGKTETSRCVGAVPGLTTEEDQCLTWVRDNGGAWMPWVCRWQGGTNSYNAMIRAEWLLYR